LGLGRVFEIEVEVVPVSVPQRGGRYGRPETPPSKLKIRIKEQHETNYREIEMEKVDFDVLGIFMKECGISENKADELKIQITQRAVKENKFKIEVYEN
jgi:hypothetical protein